MAKVYYVRDGTGDGQTNQGMDLSVDKLSERLKGHRIKFLGTNPPTFNPEKKVNPYADYQYVVIEVLDNDLEKHASPLFNRKGFYLIENLTPRGFS